MDWLAIVPVFIIGAFLLIIWNVVSPVDFIKQHRAQRKKRLKEWEELMKNDPEEEDFLNQYDEKNNRS